MPDSYAHLLQPGRIGTLELRNRIVMSPMGSNFAEDDGYCGELNVLENLWTSRVTSHVPLREVSALLSAEKVAEAIALYGLAVDKINPLYA